MKTIPLHALLFPVAPVLAIYAVNPAYASFGEVLMAIGIVWIAAALVFASGWLVLRHAARAGLLTTAVLALVFLHGPLVGLVGDSIRERYIFAALLAGIAVAGALLWRSRGSWPLLTQYLNVVTACLIALGLAQAGWALARSSDGRLTPATAASRADAPVEPGDGLPSILYLILDEYARADTLEALYGDDNADFLRELADRGFTAFDRSCANYTTTFLSLGASLNMRYLDDEARRVGRESRDRLPVYAVTRDNLVVRMLRSHGYRFVNISSGLGVTNHVPTADRNVVYGRLTPFIGTLAVSTIARPFMPMLTNRHQAILDTFEGIPGLLDQHGPVFVLAHVIAPHRPYLFRRDGQRLDAPMVESYFGAEVTEPEPYLEQLLFVNARVLDLLDEIQRRLGDNVAIVIQSDHGPDSIDAWQAPSPAFMRERLAIINAVRLPGGRRVDLPDTATPVNTLRAVLNATLGESFEPLPDRSFFSTYEHPYAWREATPCDQGAWTDRTPVPPISGTPAPAPPGAR